MRIAAPLIPQEPNDCGIPTLIADLCGGSSHTFADEAESLISANCWRIEGVYVEINALNLRDSKCLLQHQLEHRNSQAFASRLRFLSKNGK